MNGVMLEYRVKDIGNINSVAYKIAIPRVKNDFKPLKNFENYYMINSQGIIKTKPRRVKSPRGFRNVTGNILIFGYDNKRGYLQVTLFKKGKKYKLYVHRLVWETFKGDIPKDYEINHKDSNRKNNDIENLEAVTKQDNMRHMLNNNPHVLDNLKLRRG